MKEMVDGNIDFETPIEYGQLYAQLKYEVEQQRERYYLTKDEEHELMQHDLRYQRLSGLGEMLLSVYEKPSEGEQGQWLSISDISARPETGLPGCLSGRRGHIREDRPLPQPSRIQVRE